MTITARATATRRTKNRIKENGTDFRFLDQGIFKGSGLLHGRECILIHSITTDWLGWLPLDEISDPLNEIKSKF